MVDFPLLYVSLPECFPDEFGEFSGPVCVSDTLGFEISKWMERRYVDLFHFGVPVDPLGHPPSEPLLSGNQIYTYSPQKKTNISPENPWLVQMIYIFPFEMGEIM